LIEAYYGGDLNPYYHGPEDRISKFNLPFFHGMSQLSIGALSTLLEVTNDTLIAMVAPEVGYQTYKVDIHIKGVNTHFQENPSVTRMWLSKDTEVLNPESVLITSDTSLTAYCNILRTATAGWWDVHVETATDGILTKENCFNILPPPAIIAVSPESLVVDVYPGRKRQPCSQSSTGVKLPSVSRCTAVVVRRTMHFNLTGLMTMSTCRT